MMLVDRPLLAAYLAQRQMSGAQLGREAGVSRQFISQLLTGRRSSCTDDTARAVELALGLVPESSTLFRAVTPRVTPIRAVTPRERAPAA